LSLTLTHSFFFNCGSRLFAFGGTGFVLGIAFLGSRTINTIGTQQHYYLHTHFIILLFFPDHIFVSTPFCCFFFFFWIGEKITTKLTPAKSFATQQGASVAVLTSSALGLPVSTSYCLVGAVAGIGIADRCLRGSGT
jgi:hypothetical protein